MSLLNGARGYMPDTKTTNASKMNPLFTYQTIETPVNNKDNIELLKKNGDLIGKYYKQITDLVAKTKAEDLDISNDLLDLLNNFAYDRDKLFADTPIASIPSVWTTEGSDKAKNTETTTTSTGNSYEQLLNNIEAEAKDKQSDNVDRQLNAIREAAKNGEFEEPDDDEFDRSLSLTYGETKKGDKWFAEHQKKYHKDFLRKIKKNPLYGGVSPVTKCRWEWFACSIGTSCDIICEECEQKYKEAKKTYELLQDNYDVFVHDHKDDKDVYKAEKRNQQKKIAAAKKEVDKLYKQSRLTLRGLDE